MNPQLPKIPQPPASAGEPPISVGLSTHAASTESNSAAPNGHASSLPPYSSPPPKHRYWTEVLSTIVLLALAPIIALLIILFAIQSYQVDGQSMETTLQNRDRLIVDKIPRTLARITGRSYVPHRGDIIIFNQANLPDSTPGQEKQLIKRVIGLPGDRVVIKNNKITIYNKNNPGGFNPDSSVGYHIKAVPTSGNIDRTLEVNQLFVCGDNRPNSEDSRFFGPVDADQVVGKLVLRLLPLNKTEKF
jgi:signal peptidase I